MTSRLALASVSVLGLLLTAVPAALACGGFKAAHCRCRATADSHSVTPGPGKNKVDLKGTVLFTFTVPGQCFSQAADYGLEHLGRGCWKACRDAVGVDGVTPAKDLLAAKVAAAAFLRSKGACGGWYNATYDYAAGTNKYRSATAMTIGITVGGRFQVDPKTGAGVCK